MSVVTVETAALVLEAQRQRAQAVVVRMAEWSSRVKAWCVGVLGALGGLTAALAALARLPAGAAWLLLVVVLVVGLVVVAVGWLLDAYYLHLERHFRDGREQPTELLVRVLATGDARVPEADWRAALSVAGAAAWAASELAGDPGRRVLAGGGAVLRGPAGAAAGRAGRGAGDPAGLRARGGVSTMIAVTETTAMWAEGDVSVFVAYTHDEVDYFGRRTVWAYTVRDGDWVHEGHGLHGPGTVGLNPAGQLAALVSFLAADGDTYRRLMGSSARRRGRVPVPAAGGGMGLSE